MDIYHEIVQKYWGYSAFRPLQEDIIHSITSGKDTLGLMPTGGGKSLTFQVPAMSMQGLCLVVTPLIALMKDQVENLKARGIKALAVYTGMTYQEILTTFDNAILGDYKFLYISPERINSELFRKKVKEMDVNLLVIDEAHCISQWGYDFRPSYLNITTIRAFFPEVPALALTATATPEVVDDIQDKLGFKQKNVFKVSFERENLIYSVIETENKQASLTDALKKTEGSTIVYTRSRQKTKEIAMELLKNGFSADFYHAGLNNDDKNRKAAVWKNNECRIMVATNAFGMGIDKPDVRLVVHLDLPNSVEEYFQEAGRAGRDGKRADAITLYNKPDITKLKKRVTDEFPEKDFILRVYEHLAYFLQVAEGYGTGVIYDFNLHKFCSAYKLPILPTHNALKILDLSGYIEYTDEIENRSRIIFRIYRDELYKYDFNPEYDQLIHIILRLYTGLFSDYIYINEDLLASRLKVNRQHIYDMLKILAKQGVIDYIPQKKTPFILYKQPRQDTKYIVIPQSVYEERKVRFVNRIEGMRNYIDSEIICRSRMLLAYFGENDSKDCGQCDVCLSKKQTGLSDGEFHDIFSQIKDILDEGTVPVDTLIEQLHDIRKDKIIQVIRFQVDRGVLSLNMDEIKLA